MLNIDLFSLKIAPIGGQRLSKFIPGFGGFNPAANG
jgi:hypothetical protein